MGPMLDRMSDVKLRQIGCDLLTAMAEALGPKYVLAMVKAKLTSQKNPKALTETGEQRRDISTGT